MQSLLSRTGQVTQIFRARNGGAIPKQIEAQAPLFHRHPPWWARWTWGLIACDFFMTGSAIELTYNHWTTLASDPNSPKNKDESTPEEYILRPAWQRIGVCTAHMVFGAGIAAALLITQTRFVRTLAVLPASGSEGRRVFVQCAHNFRKNGLVFPFSKCSLKDGRNSTEMIFRVTGEKGHWHLALEESIIHGRNLLLPQTRAEIISNWTGKHIQAMSPKSSVELDNRWKSGPLRRAGAH